MTAEPFIFPKIDPYRPENASFLEQIRVNDLESEPTWMVELRESGRQDLFQHGLPSPLLERWKYTNLPQMLGAMELMYSDSGFMDGADHVWARKAASLTPRMQGRFRDDALWSLGRAFMRNMVVIDVPEGQDPAPVTLDFASNAGQLTQTHIFIRLGRNVTLDVNETHSGWGAYWRNSNLVLDLAEGAVLNHVRDFNDSNEALNTQSAMIAVDTGADYQAKTLLRSGACVRQESHAALNGAGANATFNGAILGQGSALLDQTIQIDHNAPDCTSNQLYRNILRDNAHGVFQGKAYVDQVAQRTDGYQLCNSVLMSERAQISVKPELEIYADDVKCSHGATSGALDEEALFYLQSRGIPKAQAKRLMLEAFLSEALDHDDLMDKAREFLHND